MPTTNRNELKKRALYNETIALMKATGLLADENLGHLPKLKIPLYESNSGQSSNKTIASCFQETANGLEIIPFDVNCNDPSDLLPSKLKQAFKKLSSLRLTYNDLTFTENKALDKAIARAHKAKNDADNDNDARQVFLTQLKPLQEKKEKENTVVVLNEQIRNLIMIINQERGNSCVYNEIIHYLNNYRTSTNTQKDAAKEAFEKSSFSKLPVILNSLQAMHSTDLQDKQLTTKFNKNIDALSKIAFYANMKKHGHRALGVLLMVFVHLIAQRIPSLKAYINNKFEKANTLSKMSKSITLFKKDQARKIKPASRSTLGSPDIRFGYKP